MASRRLIINADDLGRSRSINEGVRECVESGVVTSTSLMVRWPAAAEAARWAVRAGVSVGLHLDLGEWTCVDGEWRESYRVVDGTDADEVGREVDAQLDAFIRIAGRAPSHIDSHQHAHLEEPARTLVLQRAARLQIPVRGGREAAYCGRFYGQWGAGQPYPEGITYEALLRILDDLPAGTTELGCHPGSGENDFPSMYAAERAVERNVLCDRRLLPDLAARGIELVSYLPRTASPAWTPAAARSAWTTGPDP